MEVTFISVGKIKEKYFVDKIKENIKSLKKNYKVNNIEVADEKCPEKLSDAEMVIVKTKEGERILKNINPSFFVIALAIEGENISSEKFQKKINQMRQEGRKHFVFIIGGSLGLSDDVLKRANYKLSFSKMTFPHQLMKVILTEQVKNIL